MADQITRLRSQITDEKTRLAGIQTEMDTIADRYNGDPTLAPEGVLQRYENLQRGVENGTHELGRLEGRLESLEHMQRLAGDPANRETIKAASVTRAGEHHVEARRNIDAAHERFGLPDFAAEKLERALAGETTQAANMAAWIEASGNPEYLGAFAKRLADPESGHLNWTPAEAEAHRNANGYARTALSLSGASSMLPLTLDPSIKLSNAGSIGGIRSVCRHEDIASNAWNGVTSAGATAEWKVENAEAADGTPAVAGKNIPVWMLDIDALVSYEIFQDGLHFADELSGVLSDAAGVAVDAALASGSGSNAPKGILTALTGSQDVLTAGAFASANVTALQNALPPRFQPGAQFVMPLTIRNTVGSFETTAGALRFPETANGRLLNRQLVEDSNIPSDSTTSGSRFAVYGDWRQFLMVTRVGTSIEILPNFGPNARPTASKHFFLTLRVGADALVPNAFRVLKKS